LRTHTLLGDYDGVATPSANDDDDHGSYASVAAAFLGAHDGQLLSAAEDSPVVAPTPLVEESSRKRSLPEVERLRTQRLGIVWRVLGRLVTRFATAAQAGGVFPLTHPFWCALQMIFVQPRAVE
jgi:hypothetical protein